MKFWTRLLLLTIFDFAIIWVYVKWEDPDPSVSIGLVLLVPFVVVVNLIIAGVLYLTKRQYSLLFVANALTSAILMYYLFVAGISRHQKMRYESWNFQLQDTVYRVTHSKLDSIFYMTYSTNPGRSTGFLEGKFVDNKNFFLLTTDTTKYIIKNNYLFDFRSDSIKLTKIDN